MINCSGLVAERRFGLINTFIPGLTNRVIPPRSSRQDWMAYWMELGSYPGQENVATVMFSIIEFSLAREWVLDMNNSISVLISIGNDSVVNWYLPLKSLMGFFLDLCKIIPTY